MRTFEECWQDHREPLYTFACDLKQGSVGNADTLHYRTRERGEDAWPRFQHKGNEGRERAWLKRIMYNLHQDDLRAGYPILVSGDAPLKGQEGQEGRTWWDQVAQQDYAGSSDWLKHYVLAATIADVMVLILTEGDRYALTEEEIATFIRVRFDDQEIEKEGNATTEARAAVAKVDAVFRQLFSAILNADGDYTEEAERVAFDDRFESTVDQVEQQQIAGLPQPGQCGQRVLRAAQTSIERFRLYYAPHEPTLEECAAHFGCTPGPISIAVKKIKPHFGAVWCAGQPEVRQWLRDKWERDSRWKARWIARWQSLHATTEETVRQEQERLGTPSERLRRATAQEYGQLRRERERMQAARKDYAERYGASALERKTPEELLTRRELLALDCDGVKLPAGKGRPPSC